MSSIAALSDQRRRRLMLMSSTEVLDLPEIVDEEPVPDIEVAETPTETAETEELIEVSATTEAPVFSKEEFSENAQRLAVLELAAIHQEMSGIYRSLAEESEITTPLPREVRERISALRDRGKRVLRRIPR
ncbi:hypothetical protein [Calycomorphotria hydatis]|uniref:Uncharacterized protein n=1 Tax=Calycomorphotria hydatis TaxID=2528027 RepID=A0A517T8U6_9PLAN|nr:hypothetical protein [Calycomorphotria hydatis]QDT64783.1 hypothetical protein V22_20250 [Calycomorphotria hydatis]